MSYIIRIKMSDGYRVVTRVSKSNVHFYQNPQLLDNEHNRWSWYKYSKCKVLSYKTSNGADKMVERLSKQYPDLLFEKFEVEDELGEFKCCPNCNSRTVIQKSYAEYEQIFYRDDDRMIQLEPMGATSYSYIDGYVCDNCGQNLSGYKFNFKE